MVQGYDVHCEREFEGMLYIYIYVSIVNVIVIHYVAKENHNKVRSL